MLLDCIHNGNSLLIAEVAQAHDGSLGTAHAYIDAVAGHADAVKFQTHIAAAESSAGEPWRVRFSPQDATRYDYWRRLEFTPEQWLGLREHAARRGLCFLSSPFSLEAAELLARIGVDGWKVASGEVSNGPLRRFMLASKLPVLLSSGMSSTTELDRVVAEIQAAGRPLVLFQCTSEYPCRPERLGLNLLAEFQRRYGCLVGLSDHSGSIYPGLAAVTLGAAALEVHVTFSRDCFGPDVSSSITIPELRQLREGIRLIERAMHSPVDKNAVAEDLTPTRAIFTKSVAARVDLPPGATLREADLALRKPGTGIPADRLGELIGRVVLRPIAAGTFLREEDLLPARTAVAAGGAA